MTDEITVDLLDDIIEIDIWGDADVDMILSTAEPGLPGYNGWTPIASIVADGARFVMKIIDWTGGTGLKPDINVYVGPTGFVSLIASAVDIRGATGTNGTNGTNGDKGWSPVPAVVTDGARRVLQVVDWQGGAGTKPTTGLYVSATGLTATLASAVDVRGAAGTGIGDMLIATYDPTAKNGDAFLMTNMVEGATNKILTATERTKLAGIATGATINFADAYLLARANHTGTQSADTLTDGATNKAFLATERTKLTGIATAATANSTDAVLVDRANHTGTQLAATISNFSTAVDARIGVSLQAYNAALTGTTGTFTTAMSTKLGFISVTAAIDLDDIRLKVLGLDQAVILKGTWDASVGTFPGAGVAQAGWTYIISTGGTVNGQVFVNGDRIVAIIDNASTTTFATNWFKEDYTDAVLSVAGQTGAVVLTAADINDSATAYKFMTAAQITKLAGVATGATANQTDAYLLARANQTGTQSADTIIDGTTNHVFSATDDTKLAGIAAGATVNSTDAVLKARANHTGTQSADTITDGTTNKAFLATERTKLAAVGTMANRAVTISTAAPSGGADGDVWIQY